MQDVTDRSFWRLMRHYGGPDLYFTEYFRVYPTSTLHPAILESITANPTGRPVVAQMIGSDIPALVRTARELQRYPIAGIDLNLGCPAPVVFRKCAGGGLLRELARVDTILGALRAAIQLPFTVKTRLGFDSPAAFDELLGILARHSLDLVTIHARTVREMYRSEVHYEYIERAVARLPCPVLANGNIYSAAKARQVLAQTGARGLMIGRGAIRNPWLFQQIRQAARGEREFVPTGHEVLAYVRALYESMTFPESSRAFEPSVESADSSAAPRPSRSRERAQVQRLKKHMNYLGLGVEPTGEFLHRVRRVTTEAELFALGEEFLDHDRPMPLEPLPLALKATDVLAGEHC